VTRILRIITSADPRTGGPIEGARRVGEIWAGQGHRQDMLTLDPPDERHLADYPGRVIPIGPPRGRGLRDRYRYSPAMVPWLEAHVRDYDAIIVSGLWRYAARGAMRALAGGPVPYVVFPHGMLDPWFRRDAPLKHLGKQLSWWWAEGRLLAHARAVLFTSEEEMLRAEDAFRPYRVAGTVVKYGTTDIAGDSGAQVAAFRAAVPTLGQRRYLLFLGRLHRKKGCDLLLAAFAAVAGRDPGLDLVIAGPDQVGLVAALRADAQRAGIAARVHFPGMLGGDAKAGAYRAAEAFVLPSHQENFGIAVAEALAAGTPVLISDQVNIWREVLADRAGLVAPDTVAGTTDLLARFLALDPAERADMARHARTSFTTRFHIDRAAADLLDLIERHMA
jgi:glycosyltransferase involved in cell wall biosynthesis